MYNYNKITINNKIIEIDTKYFYRYLIKLKLANFFKEHFAGWTKFAKTKKNIEKQKMQQTTIENFLLNEYVYYNRGAVKYLVIDIDHNDLTFDELINLMEDNSLGEKKPNWVAKTKRGWQIGFILKKAFVPVFFLPKNIDKLNKKEREYILKNYQATNYFQSVMNDLYLLYKGDPKAKKVQGFFKDPCWVGNLKTRPIFIQLERFYDLYELEIAKYLPKYKITNNQFFKKDELDEIKKLASELAMGNLNVLDEIKPGMRNSFFWYFGMYLSKIDENWEERLKMYNNNIKEPLGNEFKHIIKSIHKYNKMNKNFVGLGGYNMWTPELKREYMKQYRLKKGITKKTKEMQREESKTKIINAVLKLKKEGKKITNKNIAEYACLGMTTVKKYKKELKNNEKYKMLFEK